MELLGEIEGWKVFQDEIGSFRFFDGKGEFFGGAENVAMLAKQCLLMCKRYQEKDKERIRLLRGDFTPEEFQEFFHHLEEKGFARKKFKRACKELRKKLFGPKKDG